MSLFEQLINVRPARVEMGDKFILTSTGMEITFDTTEGKQYQTSKVDNAFVVFANDLGHPQVVCQVDAIRVVS